MPTTARSLIRRALLLLGVLAAREEIPADMGADGLSTLNELVASWSLERFVVFHVERLDVPLVAGQRTYGWGVGGTINSPRPLRLEGAVLNTGALEWPLTIWTQQEYEHGLYLKHQPSTYPVGVYLASSYPLAQLHVWPVPSTALSLGLLPWIRLTSFPTLDAVVSLPEGYERALRAGLAVDLAAEYGRSVAPEIVGMLREAKGNLKAMYTVVPTLGLPAELSGCTGQAWDDETAIYRG